MNLLLDSHVGLWAFDNSPNLSIQAKQAITDANTTVYVSAVTAWEIAFKRALGKLEAPGDYLQELQLHQFTPLDISSEHALAVEHFPLHHRDPFDRLLIVQAQLENLTLVTHDERIKVYNLTLIET